MKQIKLEIRNTWDLANRIEKCGIIAITFILFLIAVTMHYADITVTSQFGLILWDSLFDGSFASFYSNCLASGIAPEGAVYDLGMYIVFAIWGLPVWILGKVTTVDALSIGVQLWFKIMLLVFEAGTTYYVYKIAGHLGLDQRTRVEVSMSYLLSFMVVFPILVASQYDVLPLFFMLGGIECWMRQKDSVRYLAWFAIAVTMKPFAVFALAACLLMREKNVLRILGDGILAMIPYGIFKLIYLVGDSSAQSNNVFFAQTFHLLTDVKINIGIGEVSVFFLLLTVIYAGIYAYQTDKQEEIVANRRCIFFLYLVFGCLCIFTSINPYWILYWAPFVSMIAFYDNKQKDFMLIINLVMDSCILIMMLIKYSWVYGGQTTFAYLLLKPLYEAIGYHDPHTVMGVMEQLGILEFQPVIAAIAMGTFIVYAYVAWRETETEESRLITEKPAEMDDSSELMTNYKNIAASVIYGIRILMLYGWVVLCVRLWIH